MDAIIRAAAVSAVPRLLRRGQGQPAPAQPAQAQPVPAVPRQPAAALSTQDSVRLREQEQREQALLEAQRKADQLKAQKLEDDAARKEAEAQAGQAAFAEAERRGYASGAAKGAAEAAEALREQVERVAAIAAALSQSKVKVLEDAHDMVVEIAFAAVCRMLGQHAARRDVVAAMVEELTAAARSAGPLCVRLHAHDLALLQGGDVLLDARVSLQADASVKIGGCMLDSSSGTLDARLETQLARLRDVMLQVRTEQNDLQGDAL